MALYFHVGCERIDRFVQSLIWFSRPRRSAAAYPAFAGPVNRRCRGVSIRGGTDLWFIARPDAGWSPTPCRFTPWSKRNI